MYDKILVPVDGSETSERAVEHAGRLASDQGAEVYVLNAIDPVDAAGGAPAASPRIIETFREEGEEIVEDAAERIPDDRPVETEVTVGTPSDTIREYAEEEDVDLIVMGTHGRTGVSRVVLGSTTERTVRITDCPVLTVNPPEE